MLMLGICWGPSTALVRNTLCFVVQACVLVVRLAVHHVRPTHRRRVPMEFATPRGPQLDRLTLMTCEKHWQPGYAEHMLVDNTHAHTLGSRALYGSVSNIMSIDL